MQKAAIYLWQDANDALFLEERVALEDLVCWLFSVDLRLLFRVTPSLKSMMAKCTTGNGLLDPPEHFKGAFDDIGWVL